MENLQLSQLAARIFVPKILDAGSPVKEALLWVHVTREAGYNADEPTVVQTLSGIIAVGAMGLPFRRRADQSRIRTFLKVIM